MALKKINWVILGVVALLAVAWVFGAQRSKQTPGIKTKSDLLSASGATVLSGSPRGIAQKVETASFSLPGFQVQAQKLDAVNLPITKTVEVVPVSPRIQKPVTVVSTSKTVSVKPASRLV